MAAHRVTGHVKLVQLARGAKWYVKYRLPDGRQVQKLLGPAWIERGRPAAGHFTRKTAEAELRRILTDAERGTKTGATFADVAAEWLQYVERDRQRRPSTIVGYRSALSGSNRLLQGASRARGQALGAQRQQAARAAPRDLQASPAPSPSPREPGRRSRAAATSSLGRLRRPLPRRG